MTTLHLFLSQPTTQWSLGVPAVLIAALTFLDQKSYAKLDKAVGLSCLALLPVSFLASWWDAGSLHIVNVFLVSLPFWVFTGRITLAQSVSLTFFSTLTVDLVAGYLHTVSRYGRPDGWLINIGGAGFEDLLAVLPVLAAAVWLSITGYSKIRDSLAQPQVAA